MSMYYDRTTREERLSGTSRYRKRSRFGYLGYLGYLGHLGIYLRFGNFALVNLKFFPRT